MRTGGGGQEGNRDVADTTRRARRVLRARRRARPAPPRWPEKPVRLVVPFVGGSSTDTIARVLALRLGEELGQNIVVENRAGAGGLLAAHTVQRAEPDGYTLLFSGAGLLHIRHLQRDAGFEPLRDFTPVARVVTNSAVCCVPADRPWRSVASLVAAARSGSPSGLAYGSGGVGTPAHLAGAALLKLSDAPGIHVPYNGANQATLALARGEVDFAFAIANIALPYIRDGRFRPLVYAGGRRNDALPEVPSFPEAVPGAPAVENWSAIFGPAGLPAPVVERLDRAVQAVGRRADFAGTMARDGNEVFLSGSPEALRSFMAQEHESIGRLVRLAGASRE